MKTIQERREYKKKYPEKFIRYTMNHMRKYSIELNLSYAQLTHALTFWSATILKRDAHICQICGGEAKLAHHIFYKNFYPKLCLNLNNGISLCLGCHHELHGYHLWRYPLS